MAQGALVLAYGAAAAVFLWVCAHFYLPGKGFTYLIMFGQQQNARFLPELKAVNHYEIPESDGYDAQYYAQLAMHPQLGDPVLRDAVDGLAYRARRILFSWTAYGLALGDPVRALHIYAVQNIACWLLLAGLLLRWFPATSWSNFVRWAGVLYSFGLCFSVRGSLVDGPSLLLIAAGVALAEAGRPGWSAALLGVAGLGKETNVLAGAALAEPRENSARGWGRVLARGALVALPLAVWLVTLKLWLGEAMNAGYRNFALPFADYAGKWREVLGQLGQSVTDLPARGSLLLLVVLTTQFLFFALRPRWHEIWWRVGAAYAVLMMFLGEAVWEGYPGAASRVLLPMALAFNILVPRGRAWFVVLLLGNLTFLLAPDTLRAPLRDTFDVSGPRALRFVPGTGQTLEVKFDPGWHGPERSRFEYWQWSTGSAAITLHNPQAFAVTADVTFGLRANTDREVVVRAGGRELWRGALKRGALQEVALRAVPLAAGDTVWQFETDRPAEPPASGDARRVAFSLRNLEITLTGRAGP